MWAIIDFVNAGPLLFCLCVRALAAPGLDWERDPGLQFRDLLPLWAAPRTAPGVGIRSIAVPDADVQRIGRRIWQNECGGTVAGLTSWNAGEGFASLGIGHFIWYPSGASGPFEESFPRMLHALAAAGAPLPDWLASAAGCPWPDRAAFLRDLDSPRMRELRGFLTATVPGQARFMVDRLEAALPKILADLPPESRAAVSRRFYRLAGTSLGVYALVDYVNFKGEGTSPSERYQGQGWGLRQVLEGAPDAASGQALLDGFCRSADEVLTRRVRNAPPERREELWLPGWRARVRTYCSGPLRADA